MRTINRPQLDNFAFLMIQSSLHDLVGKADVVVVINGEETVWGFRHIAGYHLPDTSETLVLALGNDAERYVDSLTRFRVDVDGNILSIRRL